jgi:hypothetical protein
MKQTAVEWLKEIYDSCNTYEKFISNLDWEQAKEMEKEKTIDFARHCLDKAKDLDILTAFMNVEQYYNETFKSE